MDLEERAEGRTLEELLDACSDVQHPVGGQKEHGQDGSNDVQVSEPYRDQRQTQSHDGACPGAVIRAAPHSQPMKALGEDSVPWPGPEGPWARPEYSRRRWKGWLPRPPEGWPGPRAAILCMTKGSEIRAPRSTRSTRRMGMTMYTRYPTPMAANVPRGMERPGFSRSPGHVHPSHDSGDGGEEHGKDDPETLPGVGDLDPRLRSGVFYGAARKAGRGGRGQWRP